jgi:hypothetical protein
MERLPIPTKVSAADREAIASLARCCNELDPECYKLECEVLRSISGELVPAEKKTPQALQQWWEGGFEDFKELIESLQRKQFTGQAASAWEARLAKEKAARQTIRSQIESAEAELSERVARALGLSQEEFKTVMEAVSS